MVYEKHPPAHRETLCNNGQLSNKHVYNDSNPKDGRNCLLHVVSQPQDGSSLILSLSFIIF